MLIAAESLLAAGLLFTCWRYATRPRLARTRIAARSLRYRSRLTRPRIRTAAPSLRLRPWS